MTKVYAFMAVGTAADGGWCATPQSANQMNFDADIQRLAVKLKADVHMRHSNPPAGFPAPILIECDEAFVKEVKALSNFGSVRELTATEAAATIRRNAMPQIEPPEATNQPKPRGPKGP
jgi:hypothetical protein